MKKRIVIKVERERVGDYMDVDQFLAVQSGDLKAIIDMCTFCLWDEETHAYYEQTQARAIIGKMKLNELLELGKSVHKQMEDDAVDPNSEGG